MILCYSGTGNSRYAAELAAAVLEDEIVSANDLIRGGSFPSFSSVKPYVIVCPIYAWRIPGILSDLISGAVFKGSKDVYFIVTCDSEPGSAPGYARRLCEGKGLKFRGMGAVNMPENLITLFTAPDREESRRIVADAVPVVRGFAEAVKLNLDLRCNRPSGFIKSAVLNPIFYAMFFHPEKFRITEGCSGCGKCEKGCPLGNISLVDGKPVWGDRCTMCMSCICGCPEEAVEYGKKTKGKRRYVFEAPGSPKG